MAEYPYPLSLSGKILETGKLLLFPQQSLDLEKNTQKLKKLIRAERSLAKLRSKMSRKLSFLIVFIRNKVKNW